EIRVVFRYRLHFRIRTARSDELNTRKRIRIAGRCREERILLDSGLAILRHKSRRKRIASVAGEIQIARPQPKRKRILVELIDRRLRRASRAERAEAAADDRGREAA